MDVTNYYTLGPHKIIYLIGFDTSALKLFKVLMKQFQMFIMTIN